MPSAGFEHAIAATKLPQTNAIDRATPRIGEVNFEMNIADRGCRAG
jgi:hypothetical protein